MLLSFFNLNLGKFVNNFVLNILLKINGYEYVIILGFLFKVKILLFFSFGNGFYLIVLIKCGLNLIILVLYLLIVFKSCLINEIELLLLGK